MPSWERRVCQRTTLCTCAITSLALSVGLLMFVVVYLTLSWQDIDGERSTQDLNLNKIDYMEDDCRSKATVVTDKAIMEIWDTSTNFSKAWSNAEQKAREPVHSFMEKHHSTAIYMYTNVMLQPVKSKHGTVDRTEKRLKETLASRSLYFSLSEAIQVLKHSQLTCLNTKYRTETLLNQNISNTLIRFNTFILGSDQWNFTRNTSCFKIYTCFGADITHYSAVKGTSQVLIPSYELFRVTDIETDAQRCKVIYTLKSNLNCVYDRESNTQHAISALPVGGFWLIFTITCVIIVSLLLPFVVVKVLDHKKAAVYRVSYLHNGTYFPVRVAT